MGHSNSWKTLCCQECNISLFLDVSTVSYVLLIRNAAVTQHACCGYNVLLFIHFLRNHDYSISLFIGVTNEIFTSQITTQFSSGSTTMYSPYRLAQCSSYLFSCGRAPKIIFHIPTNPNLKTRAKSNRIHALMRTAQNKAET